MTIKFDSGARNKFGAKKTEIDGFIFASKSEAARYAHLKLLVRIGEISDLELQPAFDFILDGTKICRYIADFRYREVATGEIIVEDVKSTPTKTPEYRIKKKLMYAFYGIDVRETGNITTKKRTGRK